MFTQFHLALIRMRCSPCCKEGLSQGKLHDLLLGREREVSQPVLHVLILECLQPKRIDVPKWYIWGWHVLNPFKF